MAEIFHWTGNTGGDVSLPVLPGAAGYFDPPIGASDHIRSSTSGSAVGSKISVTKLQSTFSKEFVDWLKFEDYLTTVVAGLGGELTNRLAFVLTDPDSMLNPVSGPIGTYSMRFYALFNATSLTGYEMRIFSMLNGSPGRAAGYTASSAYKWGYHLTELIALFTESCNRPFIRNGWGNGSNPTAARQGSAHTVFGPSSVPVGTIGASGGPTSYTVGVGSAPQMIGFPVRVEVQVDTNRNPKVVIRTYGAPNVTNGCDSVTPNANFCYAGNPTDVTIDRVFFGNDNTYVHSGLDTYYIGQIQMWDTYDADGLFSAADARNNPAVPNAASQRASGAPVRRKQYSWFEFRKGTGPGGSDELKPLTVKGTWVAATSSVSAADTKFTELTSRRMKPVPYKQYGTLINGNSATVSAAQLSYDAGTVYSSGGSGAWGVFLAHPLGTPPPGGWPLVLWEHSGFFSGGSFRELDVGFVEHCVSHGLAIGSAAYIKARTPNLLFNSGGYPGYPSIGNNGDLAGQYPSFITDIKNAVNWFKAKGSGSEGDGTLPINGGRIMLAGYSAGGYTVLGAALTPGLASDGAVSFGAAANKSLRVKDWPTRNLVRTRQPGTGVTLPVSATEDPEVLGVYVWGAPVDMRYACDHDATHPNYGFSNTAGSPSIPAQGLIVGAAKGFTGQLLNGTIPTGVLEGAAIQNLIARQAAAGGALCRVGYVHGGSDNLVVEGHVPLLRDALAAAGVEFDYYVTPGVIHDNLDTMFNWNHFWQFCKDTPGFLS